MANADKVELENPLASLKSPVWEHFGFAVTYKDDGQRQVDRTKAVCRHCSTKIGYAAGNTSNLHTHLKRHHPNVNITGTKRKMTEVQTQLPLAFKPPPLAKSSDRAKAITNAKYPYVAMLAKRYLAVSATSVPSERVFSTAGDIVSASRSALSASNVDKFIFLEKNMKIQ